MTIEEGQATAIRDAVLDLERIAVADLSALIRLDG
jgi:hypothetical protein